MAESFPTPPVNLAVVDDDGKLTREWRWFFSDISNYLATNLSTNGFSLPQLTSTQRDNLNSVVEGLTIYNTTTNRPEMYSGGAWNYWTLTPV